MAELGSSDRAIVGSESSRPLLALRASRVLAVLGVAAYNWWIVVALSGRLMTSTNELFSDLEAQGRPHALVFQHLDLAAGICFLAALLLRGPSADGERRGEYPWMLAFALAGVVGGRFAYACPEGLSRACRSAEWQLELPWHHYVHVLAGIVELTAATVAIALAWRRTRGAAGSRGSATGTLLALVLVAYPLLGAAYLTDRMGALIEPVFFICFSTMLLIEIFEGTTRPKPASFDPQRSDASLQGPS